MKPIYLQILILNAHLIDIKYSRISLAPLLKKRAAGVEDCIFTAKVARKHSFIYFPATSNPLIVNVINLSAFELKNAQSPINKL